MGGITRFMMKSQVSQGDAGLDEQPLGVGPVITRCNTQTVSRPYEPLPIPTGRGPAASGRLVSGTLNFAIEDQYNQYVIEGQAERIEKLWVSSG